MAIWPIWPIDEPQHSQLNDEIKMVIRSLEMQNTFW